MAERPVVEAVIVNHNTSLFSTLALRSLAASAPVSCDMRITVMDNHSDDADVDDLRSAVDQVGSAFVRSRWPAATGDVNTHGDVLRDLVLSHSAADYFLFVDCDIDFDKPATVDTMPAARLFDTLGLASAEAQSQGRVRSTRLLSPQQRAECALPGRPTPAQPRLLAIHRK